jgi:hypothetical protein
MLVSHTHQHKNTHVASTALHCSSNQSEPQLSFSAEQDETFHLTGRTGSLMYMAPEVYKELPYSEKVRCDAGYLECVLVMAISGVKGRGLVGKGGCPSS